MSEEKFLKMYAEALSEVKALGGAFENEMKNIEKDFSKEYFCWMFENLLQFSLLEISWVDGKIDPREVLIINMVTKYGDITFIVEKAFFCIYRCKKYREAVKQAKAKIRRIGNRNCVL